MAIIDLKRIYFQVLKYHSWLVSPKSNVDLVLQQLLRKTVDIDALNDPLAFITLLRGCIEHLAYSVKIKKDRADGADILTKRFRTLIQSLEKGVPSLKLEQARRIALYADEYAGLKQEKTGGIWLGHIQDHFKISSSFATKGRLLYTAARTLRSDECLECGTAYGMSAAFILSGMDEAEGGRLVTIDRDQELNQIVAPYLRRLFPDRITFELGDVHGKLSEMKQRSDAVNPELIFHDAGHSREDYVRDFAAILDLVKNKAVLLLDDIRWEDVRFIEKPAHSYRGWQEVIAHPRVEMAVEIDGALGMVLFAGD